MRITTAHCRAAGTSTSANGRPSESCAAHSRTRANSPGSRRDPSGVTPADADRYTCRPSRTCRHHAHRRVNAAYAGRPCHDTAAGAPATANTAAASTAAARPASIAISSTTTSPPTATASGTSFNPPIPGLDGRDHPP